MTSWKSRLMKLLVNDIWHSWVGTSPTTLHTYSDTIFILYSKQVVQCAFTFTSKAYAVNMYWTREYMQVCIGPTPMQLPTTLSIDHFVGRVSLPGKWWPKIRPISPLYIEIDYVLHYYFDIAHLAIRCMVASGQNH